MAPPTAPVYLQQPAEELDSEPQGEDWPIPALHLRVWDISSPGSGTFFANVQLPSLFREAVIKVLHQLYTPATAPDHVRSITLILRAMQGVAYTKGSDLDNDHKEIHFSTDYIQSAASRAHDEILGVLVHEIVHCFQFNANGTCPGGLIEGIADWVRLKADLGPPHWRRGGGSTWDQGYEITGYFLDWIDKQYDGAHTSFVVALNQSLDGVDYDEAIFDRLTGKSVRCLWEEYKSEIENGESRKAE